MPHLVTAQELVTEAMDKSLLLDLVKDAIVGQGAFVLPRRQGTLEPCGCCLIDERGSRDDPENRICTTKGAIGTLTNDEEASLCSEVVVVGDGRCGRARNLRKASKRCREQFPDDNKRFLGCFIPAFGATAS